MTRLPLLIFVVVAAAAGAVAQDKSKTTFTDPAQADVDFAFQGEYAAPGWGLQVIAEGGGKFAGVLYQGGLPGNGWNQRSPVKLTGALENDAVTLQGDVPYRFVLDRRRADWLDSWGRQIGRLARWNRMSRTMGLRPPPGATVLFDGTSADHFQNGKLTDDGLLRIGTMTKEKVGDFRLHLEFCTPYMPYARGQGRANSGVYIQQRYEVQILDSFGLEGIENECASLYRQQRPNLNMALPPLTWQTYDIWFRQPRWSEDGKTKIEPARITVLHNGVAVHWNYALTNKTGGGKPEGPEEFPIALQDHGNPVVFRNIWMVPGEGLYPSAPPAARRPSNACCCTPYRRSRRCCLN
jgi:hypothetical protein